jgi:hypothetical protein
MAQATLVSVPRVCVGGLSPHPCRRRRRRRHAARSALAECLLPSLRLLLAALVGRGPRRHRRRVRFRRHPIIASPCRRCPRRLLVVVALVVLHRWRGASVGVRVIGSS